MKTCFASPDRWTDEHLQEVVTCVSNNPLIDTLLQAATGLMAVLNHKRQILAVNQQFLDFTGIDNPDDVLGVRPGEAVRCVRSDLEEGGCGTSEYCQTCGGTIAILASIATDKPASRTCAVEVTKDKGAETRHMFFRVEAHPVRLEGYPLILMFLQDVTKEQDRSVIENLFFYDVKEIASSLQERVERVMNDGVTSEECLHSLYNLALRLSKELAVQHCLLQPDECDMRTWSRPVEVKGILESVSELHSCRRAGAGKTLRIEQPVPDVVLETDEVLLGRVLGNMVVNAMEASEDGDEVLMRADQEQHSVLFAVWNRSDISEDVAKRVFQRNFSTKASEGRGIGTYSMKLLGESYLNGEVGFTTSADEGTTFWIRLPNEPPA